MPSPTKLREPITNLLLAALPRKELQRLLPYLEVCPLTFGEILYEPAQRIRHVYFPNSGIVSLLSVVEEHSALEVGMVGNEGMVGISIFLGVPKALNQALVQGSGTALRMTAQAFRQHVGSSGALPDALRPYTHQLMQQVSQTAVCNRFHKTTARLARWLLMTRDRLASNEFELTQQFLADMIGVRREGVTAAARELQQAQLIRYVRGQITILDRTSLEALACRCYAVVKLAHATKASRNYSAERSSI